MRQSLGIVAWVVVFGTAVIIAPAGCSKTQSTPKPAAIEKAAAQAASQAPAAAVAEPSTGTNLDELRRSLAAAKGEDARVLAVDEIAKLGQNARGALDDLVAATADPAVRVRWHAARGIGLIGEDAISAMPTLVKLLGDEDPIVVTQSAAAIGLIRTDDEVNRETPAADTAAYDSAATALVATMVHPDPRARRASLRTLVKLRPEPEALGPLISRQLADADPSVVLPALHSLADMGADAVPFLAKSLEDPKARYWASVALAEIGPAAAPAVESLRKNITTGETEECMQAILTLAAIGEPAAAAAPEILKSLESSQASVRFAAAYALGRLRAAAADAALEKAADDADPFLAAIASWARARIRPDDKPLVEKAVTKLRAGLASPKPSVQTASISALSDLTGSIDDEEEKSLAKEFVGLLASPEPGVRVSAGAALVRQGSLAVDAVEEALAVPATRSAAAEILASIGPAAKAAVDSLIASLSDTDPTHRGDAAVALGAIGPDAATAVPKLEELLASSGDDAGLRYAAAYALGRIGAAAKPAVSALKELAKSPDELMATVAIWAVLKIEPEDESLFETAVPLLRKALRSDQQMVRFEAAVALGDMGPAAETAIPILELVSEDDPVESVRKAAKQALAQIRANGR